MPTHGIFPWILCRNRRFSGSLCRGAGRRAPACRRRERRTGGRPRRRARFSHPALRRVQTGAPPGGKDARRAGGVDHACVTAGHAARRAGRRPRVIRSPGPGRPCRPAGRPSPVRAGRDEKTGRRRGRPPVRSVPPLAGGRGAGPRGAVRVSGCSTRGRSRRVRRTRPPCSTRGGGASVTSTNVPPSGGDPSCRPSIDRSGHHLSQASPPSEAAWNARTPSRTATSTGASARLCAFSRVGVGPGGAGDDMTEPI